jgi:hypothetical protein
MGVGEVDEEVPAIRELGDLELSVRQLQLCRDSLRHLQDGQVEAGSVQEKDSSVHLKATL